MNKQIKALKLITLAMLFLISCTESKSNPIDSLKELKSELKVGAKQTEKYFPLIQGKRIGVVVNQTAIVDSTNIVDFLVGEKMNITKIFGPEHGFRGDADAGEHVKDMKDIKTNIPVYSLYGENRKPSPELMKDVDVMVFDIQDVGVRFYTFISTLHYVMEACAENNVPLIILDRPNPNGDYVAGPLLDTAFSSFVGKDPIPVVHGLTVGELAQMINGEGWLKNKVTCKLTVIPVSGWTHADHYSLPEKPSPNLASDLSVRLYPSLCYFEPTIISIGRGTLFPFEVIGYPDSTQGSFSFTPESIKGMSSSPKHLNEKCYGEDLRKLDSVPKFTLKYLIDYYSKSSNKDNFFTNEKFFNLLAGNGTLIKQIKAGLSLEEIESSWKVDLDEYMEMRSKYLLYP